MLMGHRSPGLACVTRLAKSPTTGIACFTHHHIASRRERPRGTAANGSKIPYKGYVEVKCSLAESLGTEVTVPMLVTQGDGEQPIIGYNVIEELIKYEPQHDKDTTESPEQLLKAMRATFPTVKSDSIQALVELVKCQDPDTLGILRTTKKDITIPSRQTVFAACRVNTGPVEKTIPVLFEPDEEKPWPVGLEAEERILKINQGATHRVNVVVKNTRHDIVLSKRTVLGQLQLVRSVTPVEVKRREATDTGPNSSYQEPVAGKTEEVTKESDGRRVQPDERDVPEVALGKHLTETQRELVRNLLRSEADTFSKNDEDLGTIEDLEMEIQLSDHNPVQKTYVYVPRPLYPEVKQYLEDILNRGWIKKSKSPYSSPVVCVRKKDGGLLLCVDYRELNRKTIPDRHPIPRVQEMLGK